MQIFKLDQSSIVFYLHPTQLVAKFWIAMLSVHALILIRPLHYYVVQQGKAKSVQYVPCCNFDLY